MTDREKLEESIAHLEGQRGVLSDSSVDAAIDALREKLSQLEAKEAPSHAEDGHPSLAGERRLVTILFADVSGFTALSETMDPEAVREIMNSCFDKLVPIVKKYGGAVDKFIGDEIMALFGAPVAHENDPERALLAALEMKEALADLNAEKERNLNLHFGINTGSVIAGGLGASGQQEYSVMGDAVNVAKRLEDVSEAGEIMVGAHTYRSTAHLFKFESLKPIHVKGRKEPVAAYRLLGRESGIRAGRLQRRGISSRLVGRATEFGKLKACVDRLFSGEGGILSIIGEAGLGKSRLVAEIRADTLGTPSSARVQWLEGRTLSFGQAISYWPFQELLRDCAGISEEDNESAAWDKLRTRITSLFGDKAMEILPYLASVISLEVKGDYADRVKYLDGEAMRRQIFLASRRFFERLAQTQPLVLVFEDLHWVDESSAMLLEHLLPLVESLPILICAISRPDPITPAMRLREIASNQYSRRYSEVALFPLSTDSSRELIQSLLDDAPLIPGTVENILRKAEGNPFFVEEIIQSLIDQGVVIRDRASGRWQIMDRIEGVTIPDTIQGVIMSRVDRLDEDMRQLLRTAAVIGRIFLYRVLRAIMEAGEELDLQLEELQGLELIRMKQRVPELEYMFRHALTQEATYESLLVQKRQEIHRRIGEAIEKLFSDRLEEFYALLAYHYAKAEAWEKAQKYLFKAGDQAGGLAADAEALICYRQAMDAYAQAFGDRWDPVERASLHRKVGEALFRRGSQDQALEHYQRALQLLGCTIPGSHWKMRFGIFAEMGKQLAHRILPGLFCGEVGESVDPALQEIMRVIELICWIDAFSNNERLLYLVLRILNSSERVGFDVGIAKGRMGVGLACDLLSRYSLAAPYHEGAMFVAEASQHLGALGLVHTGLGTHYMCLAKWDRAIEHNGRAGKLFQDTGDLHGWGYVTYLVAFATAVTGNMTGALATCQHVSTIGEEIADPQVRCWGLSTKGFILRRMGLMDEAVEALLEAKHLSDSTIDLRFRMFSRGELGRCYSAKGQMRRAVAELEESRKFQWAHKGSTMLWTWLPHSMGFPEAYLAGVESGDKSDREHCLGRAREACAEALQHGKRFPGVMPEAMRLKGTSEWLRGKQRSARKWWTRSVALAEELKQPYDIGMTLLEMGQRSCDPGCLDRAESILAGIGAEHDLERVRFARTCL